ncbi:MAG: sugar phosphate isomerase/epimerase, partial [Oscillospiraceae bacterium]|nr:sugar phosphate isomerase/epimerase [Oscillospiraceae bacterium]
MNLSFSTRGWGDLSFESLIEVALDMKFTGIEVYNLFKFPALTDRGGPFHKHSIAATVRQLRDLKLKIPCLDTSLDLSESAENAEILKTVMRSAHDLRVPYVVCWASKNEEELIRSGIDALLPLARETGVGILLKTSGIFADTARLRAFLESYACDELGALWDMHHPYRDFGESADTTIKNLGTYVRHVHLRDSDDADTYNLIGEGSLPVSDMMRALSSINYDGFISLEWKPEWMEDLQDREIIFPHFVNYMSRFNNPRMRKKSLYYNHDG